MGDAKRKQQQAATWLPRLPAAVEQVASAVRRLASAASSSLGSDCYLHAELGRALLEDLGIPSKVVSGYAAWRVGPGDGDVVSHTPHTPGHLPQGVEGFAYHAWLNCAGRIVDLTAYQLRKKAADLDAADGGHTQVLWCPDYLVLDRQATHSYREVAQSLKEGVCHYEERPAVDVMLRPRFALDPEDLSNARFLMAHPHITVFGPNQWRED